MKGLKEFTEDLAKDNKLREKFKDLKDVKEIIKLAKKEGYKFTEDEYMDKQMENVSGGFSIKDLINPTEEMLKTLNKKRPQQDGRLSTKPYFGPIEPFGLSRLNIPDEN